MKHRKTVKATIMAVTLVAAALEVATPTRVQAQCIRYEIQPVDPYPGGGSYPVGTIIGPNSITLPPGPAARIWLEVRISNWACSGHAMGTWQAKLGPEAALPPGIVVPAQPCTSAAQCTAAGFGPGNGTGCGLRTPNECDTVFEQQPPQQPTAMNFDIEACNSPGLACGATQVSTPPITDTGAVRYAMTFVGEVTAGFVGVAVIQFQNPGSDTFFQDENGTQRPIGELIGATVNKGVVGTGFTYQGFLEKGNPLEPVADNCDFKFSLWDDLEPGAPDNQIGGGL